MTSEKQIGMYEHSEVKDDYFLLRIANSIEELGGNVFQISKQYSAVTIYFKIPINQDMHKFEASLDEKLYRW